VFGGAGCSKSILDFGFWILDWILDFGLDLILGFGFDFGFWILD
jgi:hypothetical protein